MNPFIKKKEIKKKMEHATKIKKNNDIKLDNDEETLSLETDIINMKLKTIDSNLCIKERKDHKTYNTFVLCSLSTEYNNEIEEVFQSNSTRYMIINEYIEENYEDDDDTEENLSNFMSTFPIKKNTLGIRRFAFEKLKRPLIISLCIYSILFCILCFILYCIYIILF